MNTFHDIANIYERQGESLTQSFAARMIEQAKITQDDYIIDVACGTGGLAVLAAAAGARVVATDLSPAMVARTGERLRPYAGSEAQVMSCDALSVPDAQFDVAFSNMAVLILPVWRQGLSELVRVTKPGGRIAISAWTSKRDATPGYLAKRIF